MAKDNKTPKRKEVIRAFDIKLKKLEPIMAQRGDLRAPDGTLGAALVEAIQSDYLPIIDNWAFQPNEAARAPRSSALTRLIDEIYTKYPNIDANELIKKLELHCNCGVILSIMDDDIEWVNDKGQTKFTKLSALKSRLYRVKKKRQSRR